MNMHRAFFLLITALLCLSRAQAATVPGLAADLQPHVLLYAPFEGTGTAAVAKGNPEPLVSSGLQFEPGKVGQGLRAGKDTRCAYATAGNLDPAQGTVMMWLKRGAGGDALFTIGPWYGADFVTFRAVDGQNVTTSHLKQGGQTVAVVQAVGVPALDAWHHVAITWDSKQLRLFVDGAQRGFANVSGALSGADLADRMWIGTAAEGIYAANSVIDDLCILDVPLTPDQPLAYTDPAVASQMAQRLAKRQSTALRTLFHVGFEGADPLRADQAEGNPAPAAQDKLQMVPGLSGKGVLIQGEAILAYDELGNLDKDYGSFEMWVKLGFDETNPPSLPCFFQEDAPLGPVPMDNIWLFMWNQSAFGLLRCDRRVLSGMDDVIYASIPGGVIKDTWHQLVVNWDSRVGQRLFIDGQTMPYFVSDRPFGLRGFTWAPQEHPRFFLGNRGRDVYHSVQPIWGACESVVDEFSIYSRPLSPAEVADHYVRGFGAGGPPPLILIRQAAVVAGETYRPLFDLKNRFDLALQGKLDITLVDDKGSCPVLSSRLAIAPQAQTSLQAPALKLAAGQYAFVYTYNGRKVGQQALSVLPRPASPTSAGGPVLIGKYDAVAMREGRENYRESLPSRVGALGDMRYVEAGDAQFARLAFRFKVEHPGRPHLLRVFYPDDKDRAFDVIVNSPTYPCTYDTQGGVLTGREYENTEQSQHYDVLYWPREQDQALYLTTWIKGAPAAISGFEVSELQGPLPAALSGPVDPGKRRLGLYSEDMMLSEAFGGRHHETDAARFTTETADRMVEYMKSTGQNQLIYPITFYQGPSYLSLSENLMTCVGQRHPQEYVDVLLRRFEQAGPAGEFGFLPSLNACLSPSLVLPIEKYAKTPEAGYLQVDEVLAWQDPRTGLFTSTERSSDEPCVYPCFVPGNAMSCVCLEHVAELCEELWGELPRARELVQLAAQVRRGLWECAVVEDGQFGRIFAFEVGEPGEVLLYDHADMPNLLSMARFGFCAADDPVYRNTVNFAYSTRNQGYRGTVDGKYRQLCDGSKTMPFSPWSLGALGQLMSGTATPAEMARLLGWLRDALTPALQLPEISDRHTGLPVQRYWFGWPTAMLLMAFVETICGVRIGRQVTIEPQIPEGWDNFCSPLLTIRGRPVHIEMTHGVLSVHGYEEGPPPPGEAATQE